MRATCGANARQKYPASSPCFFRPNSACRGRGRIHEIPVEAGVPRRDGRGRRRLRPQRLGNFLWSQRRRRPSARSRQRRRQAPEGVPQQSRRESPVSLRGGQRLAQRPHRPGKPGQLGVRPEPDGGKDTPRDLAAAGGDHQADPGADLPQEPDAGSRILRIRRPVDQVHRRDDCDRARARAPATPRRAPQSRRRAGR